MAEQKTVPASVDVDALAVKVAAASAKAARLEKIRAAGLVEAPAVFVRVNPSEAPLSNVWKNPAGLVAPEDLEDFPKGSVIREGGAIKVAPGCAKLDGNFREATLEEAASLVTVNEGARYAIALRPVARAEAGVTVTKDRQAKAGAAVDKARKALAEAEAALLREADLVKVSETALANANASLEKWIEQSGRTEAELRAALASIAASAPTPAGRPRAYAAPGSSQGADGNLELPEARI